MRVDYLRQLSNHRHRRFTQPCCLCRSHSDLFHPLSGIATIFNSIFEEYNSNFQFTSRYTKEEAQIQLILSDCSFSLIVEDCLVFLFHHYNGTICASLKYIHFQGILLDSIHSMPICLCIYFLFNSYSSLHLASPHQSPCR